MSADGTSITSLLQMCAMLVRRLRRLVVNSFILNNRASHAILRIMLCGRRQWFTAFEVGCSSCTSGMRFRLFYINPSLIVITLSVTTMASLYQVIQVLGKYKLDFK